MESSDRPWWCLDLMRTLIFQSFQMNKCSKQKHSNSLLHLLHCRTWRRWRCPGWSSRTGCTATTATPSSTSCSGQTRARQRSASASSVDTPSKCVVIRADRKSQVQQCLYFFLNHCAVWPNSGSFHGFTDICGKCNLLHLSLKVSFYIFWSEPGKSSFVYWLTKSSSLVIFRLLLIWFWSLLACESDVQQPENW